MRFWFSLLYLIIALGNIVAINVYLGIIKKLFNYAKAFMFTVTFPSFAVVAFFLAGYSSVASHPMAIFPQVSWETTFIGIVALDTLVVGFGAYVFFKPKWWYVAIGGGAAITGAAVYSLYKPSWGTGVFVSSAIALAIACMIVLAVSLYILLRIWKETNREKRPKRR
jgi:hypothetical protein